MTAERADAPEQRIPVLYRTDDYGWIMLGENGEKFEIAANRSPLGLAMSNLFVGTPRSETAAMHQTLPLPPQPETKLTTTHPCVVDATWKRYGSYAEACGTLGRDGVKVNAVSFVYYQCVDGIIAMPLSEDAAIRQSHER